MKILHIATRHRRGGAEKNVAFTIAWESEQGHEVHLAVGPDSLQEELPTQAATHVIPDLVRSVSPARDVRAVRAIRDLIRRTRFDLVHTHQSKAGVLGRLAARGEARVVLHTIHMASFGPAYNPVASRIFQWAEQRCAPVTTRILSVGRELRDMYLAAGIGRSAQYLVLRSPIDLTAFDAARTAPADERRRARARLGLQDGIPVALVLASLEPRKRVGLVLDELAGRARAGRIQILVGGDGPERAKLEQRVSDLEIGDRVVFSGHLERPAEAFAAADVLVHAATVEGVPQVVVQALAAGLPVAATDMIGLREVDDAPVEIAAPTGSGLDAAVGRALGRPRTIVPIAALGQWSPESVRDGLARLYATLPLAPP